MRRALTPYKSEAHDMTSIPRKAQRRRWPPTSYLTSIQAFIGALSLALGRLAKLVHLTTITRKHHHRQIQEDL
jgi:hypothetical protein